MNLQQANYFASLIDAERVWVIGAIHSEANSLKSIHQKISLRYISGDKIVYLGNVIGVGKNVIETIDELLHFRKKIISINGSCETTRNMVFLRGAQEEMLHKLLQVQLAVNPAEIIEWLETQGVNSTLEAYGGSIKEAIINARGGARDLALWTNKIRKKIASNPGHQDFLSALKRAAITSDGSLLFVNSGIDPERPLDAQKDSFWWDNKGFNKLDGPFCGFTKVVRGFALNHPGIESDLYTITVDGGSGFGGKLMAACINLNGEIIEQIES